MTTEARHSSLPPGPSPSSGPRAGAGWSAGSGIPAGVPGRASADGARVTAAAPLGDDPGDEPSVFTPRGPADAERPADGTSRGRTVPEAVDSVSPPPPPASARFPDAPPRAARPRTETDAPRPAYADASGGSTSTGGTGSGPGDGGISTASTQITRIDLEVPLWLNAWLDAPARPPTGVSAHATRPTTRWHPQPPAPHAPDPARTRQSAARPHVTFGEPDLFRVRRRGRAVVAGVCLVLGIGLIGGAAAGSWIAEEHEDSAAQGFAAAVPAWHSVPVDTLFPPVVQGAGDGPGGADRTWTRIAVAPDGGCADGFDPLLWKVLADAGCRRLLRATYTDATQSYVTTVGLLFTKADPAGMSALATRFRTQHLAERPDLMPRPYAARNTPAAGFGDDQRATWTISVRTDAPVVVYAVSGWADGRSVDTPQPAADAVRAGATTAQAQSGLGDEAQGLSGQIARRLRRTVGSTAPNATKRPS
ncbi:hypothetical protein [Streptomyces sp. LaBMicrA B280]|uniref:hypothetical protein n=1 Tax=Streptomyces sp. LaBMicrA B280 TaxID=3391001 RepID=UPI003BA73652